jgi:hypothetical protein
MKLVAHLEPIIIAAVILYSKPHQDNAQKKNNPSVFDPLEPKQELNLTAFALTMGLLLHVYQLGHFCLNSGNS